jgi:hypothetical protein
LKYALQSSRPIIKLIISRHTVTPSYTPPTVLHLNRESRNETTKWFTKSSLSDPVPVSPSDTSTHRDVFVDLQNDVIYLRFAGAHPLDGFDTTGDIMDRNRTFLERDHKFYAGDHATQALWCVVGSISEDQRNEIQHVAIDVERWPGEYGEESPDVHVIPDIVLELSKFPNLKTLVVFIGGEERTEPIRERVFVHATPCSMAERNAMERILDPHALALARNTIQEDFDTWMMPKVEVVYRDGLQKRCTNKCGCGPAEGFKLIPEEPSVHLARHLNHLKAHKRWIKDHPWT